jgi:hypothetical protein
MKYNGTMKLLQEVCGLLQKKILFLLVSTHAPVKHKPPVLIIHRFVVIQMNLDHAMEVAVYSQVPVMETNEQFMAMR